MEIASLLFAILGLIPVGYFVYTTYIRKPHSIDFDIGNVCLVRVASPNRNRDEKLALVIFSLAFVNTAATSLTIKKVLLAYRFDRKRCDAKLTDIPTGIVDGRKAITFANSKDNIIAAWTSLHETLSNNIPLQTGAVLKGDAVFLLDAPIPRLRDITDYAIVVQDYFGGRSIHKLTPGAGWYEAHAKNFSLMDAPVRKVNDQIRWEGLSLRKP